MSSDFVNASTIFSIASRDVGFFGIFSGEQKKRIDLGGAEDKTHRLAIAYFDDKIDDNLEFEKWVKLKLPGGTVKKAEIASIAARLNISRSQVIKLAKADSKNSSSTLEKAINEKVKAYKDDLDKVKNFYQLVSNFLQSDPDRQSLKSFKKEVEAFDPSQIHNKNAQKVCLNYRSQLLRILRNLNKKITSKNIIIGNHAQAEIGVSSDVVKKNVALAKDKIEKCLKEFDFELFHIDRNFSIKISAPKNVVRKLWGSHNLVHEGAKKIGKATGRLGVRLQLLAHDVKNKFSILTDGNIYHQKPSATKGYVPYSKDEKTWLLLNVKSLVTRLGLDSYGIKADGSLNKLIDERMEVLKEKQLNKVFFSDNKGHKIDFDKRNKK